MATWFRLIVGGKKIGEYPIKKNEQQGPHPVEVP